MPRLPICRSFPFATMTALCALAGAAAAQDMPPSSLAANGPPPAAAPAPAPAPQATAEPATLPSPGPATPAAHPLSKAQLDQLVAPIALYPDPLLGQVLMAATYPLEIVEAERWMQEPAHQGLKGDALTQALKEKNWDPSVMALVPFPKLLALMADKLEWTEALGNAFLAQQADVMSAVQDLRHTAMAAGNLKATPQCHCVIKTSGDVISILPADNEVVCVPVYNPRVAYGAWPWPDYPPDYFPIPAGFVFEPDYPIGFWPLVEVAAFGPLWGWWSLDWGHNSIAVDPGRYGALGSRSAFSGTTWVHDPAHRGGVAYGDPAVTARFGAARTAAVTAAARAGISRGAITGAGVGAATGGRFAGAGASAGRFSSRGAAPAGPAAGGHVAHTNFAAPRSGAAHFGGGHSGGGAAHFGGGGGGGHIAHAQFSPGGGHFGGAPHGGGGGGGPHGGGGGGPHGGGGGGGPHGGGGGGGGGGGHGGGHH